MCDPLLFPFSSSSLLQYGRAGAHWAAAYGHLEALCTLLAAGANPAAADNVRGEEEGYERVAWGPVKGRRGGKRDMASSSREAGRVRACCMILRMTPPHACVCPGAGS